MSQAVRYHRIFNIQCHKKGNIIAYSIYDITSTMITLHTQYTMSQTKYCGYEVMISGIGNRWIYVAVLNTVMLQWGTTANTNCGSLTLESIVLFIKCCPVHTCAVASLYQTNTNKYTHKFTNHHLINTIHNSNMFHHFKGHFQGVQLIHSSSMGQQNESLVVKFNLVCSMYCAM
jgi:hypothetical protein